MASYTRRSTFGDGDLITAALFNNEYNQLVDAFSNTTGHKHDGTVGEGPVIGIIGDAGVVTPFNKILVDSTNDHIEFWIDVSGTSTQQFYIADGAIVPVTDNDIDLGTSSLQFKDLYINGTANIDSLVADTADINGGTIDGVTIGASSAGAITGTTITATSFVIGNANITETELEILDGATLTTTELNYVDGVTSSIQTQINTKAPLASPSLTGIPTAPTAASNTNTTQVATTAYVQTEITDLIDAAPGTLDTLNELAAAINDDANYNSTLTTALATKLPLAGGTMTGNVTYSDNVKAQFGTSQDLQIYHDGSNSFIKDAGTGNLNIIANELAIYEGNGTDLMIGATPNGAVTLSHNAQTKLATTSTGIDVTGVITTDGLTTSADINFGDNDKAVFGAGGDLEIYHDGSHSYVRNTVTGNLYIRNLSDDKDIILQSDDGAGGLANYVQVDGSNGEVRLSHYGSEKFNTTSTGIDVTGTVVSDGLTVEGDAKINDTDATPLVIQRNGGTDANTSIHYEQNTYNTYVGTGNSGTFVVGNSADLGSSRRFAIEQNNDISFYEDTGSTAKLFWDASAESLGIGTTSPSRTLHIKDSVAGIRLEDSDGTSYGEIIYNEGSNGLLIRSDENNADSGSNIIFEVDGGEKARIDSSGNVLVGKTSASSASIGFQAGQNGFTAITRASAQPLVLNRTTNDGIIVEFKKDSTQVGSIGAYNSATAILSGSAGSYSGLYLNTNKIEPVGNNFGSEIRANNTIDIGSSTYKFKDIYLSGTANFGSLSDGTITITGFVDEDNMATNSATLVPTQQSVKAYVDSQVSSAGGNGISFEDNEKAQFGDGNDLQIYHDGNNSRVEDTGTGGLRLIGGNFVSLQSTSGENMVVANENGAVTLYHNNSAKLATTSTGIDVTGTVKGDGLIINGGASSPTHLINGSRAGTLVSIDNESASTSTGLLLNTASTNANSNILQITSNDLNRFKVSGSGDISFYDSAGTTQGLFWDASTERLGIGNTSPTSALDVTGTITSDGLTVSDSQAGGVTAQIQNSNPTQTGGTRLDFLYSGSTVTGRIQNRFNGGDFQTDWYTGNDGLEIFTDLAKTEKRLDIASNGDISFYEDTGTTAQITWDASADALRFTDNTKVTLGSGNDLQIFHDGSNSYINQAGTGSLNIQNNTNDADINLVSDNGSGGTTTYFKLDGSLGYSRALQNIRFDDSVKATFGNVNDLQIYHDGTHSHIINATGDLTINSQGDDLILKASDDFLLQVQETDIAIQAVGDGKVGLRYNNAEKLATTSTGINVTGTVTSDGLTVDGAAQLNGDLTIFDGTGDPFIKLQTNEQQYVLRIDNSESDVFQIRDTTNSANRLAIANNGDISFYDDTGSTQGLFWDASAESLGIGTTSPSQDLEILNGVSGSGIRLAATSTAYWDIERDPTSGHLTFTDDGAGTVLTVGQDGKVGIGTTSPQTELEISAAQSPFLRLTSEKNGTHDAGDIYGELQFYTQETFGNAPVVAAKYNLYIQRAGTGHDNSDAGLAFFTSTASSNATATERMRIESATGNVGIGTDSPAQALEIAGSVRIDNGASFTAYEVYRDNILYGKVGGGSNQFTIQASNNKDINIFDDSGNGLTVEDGGNVGIGTTNPDSPLKVSATASSSIPALGAASSHAAIGAGGFGTMFGTRNTGIGYIQQQRFDGTATAYSLALQPNGGNVGIGTASPSASLHISNTYPVIRLTDSDGTAPYAQIINSSGLLQLRADDNNSTANSAIQFFVDGGGEKARIDLSGNLLVSTTNASVDTGVSSGVVLSASDQLLVGTSASHSAAFNRIGGADGDIIQLKKNGSSVGSIGVINTNNLTIGGSVSNHSGLQFGTAVITPMRANSESDAQIDIGFSNARFKDLYLSNNIKAHGASSPTLDLKDTTNNCNLLAYAQNSTANIGTYSNHPLIFDTNSTERMRIDSAGNVGIGTSSPSQMLELSADNGAGAINVLRFNDSDTAVAGGQTTGRIEFAENDGGDTTVSAFLEVETVATAGGGIMTFGTGTAGVTASEKMRLDHSGNLLVGKTSSSTGVAGARFSANGFSNVTRDGGECINFNRLTSDGTIIDFRKDSVTVGNIGTSTTDLFIGTGVAGLRFREAGPQLMPWNTTTNAANDSAIDIGKSDAKFKDLHLSGTISSGAITVTGSAGTLASFTNASDADLLIKAQSGITTLTPTTGTLAFGTSSTERMRIDSSGNVGIGTTSVIGNFNLHGGTGDTASQDVVQTFTRISSTGNVLAAKIRLDNLNTNHADLKFQVKTTASSAENDSYYTDALTIQGSSGKVGIGTTAPSSTLDVESSASTVAEFKSTADIARISLTSVDSSDGSSTGYIKTQDGKLTLDADIAATGSTPAISFEIEGDEQVRIKAGSKVGIGTDNPSHKLDIVGGGLEITQEETTDAIAILDSTFSNTKYFSIQGDQGDANLRADAGDLVLMRAGTNRLTCTSSGVVVNGALSKSSGSFKIDHPLKSDTHHLVHSFIEGPQADNLYRGVVQLEKGKAVINLDDWFNMTTGTFLALNRDIQAFVNNSETWDAVRANVKGSQLIIECQNSESNATVSWLVIGERQDKEIYESILTDDNGKIIVEPQKSLNSENKAI